MYQVSDIVWLLLIYEQLIGDGRKHLKTGKTTDSFAQDLVKRPRFRDDVTNNRHSGNFS